MVTFVSVYQILVVAQRAHLIFVSYFMVIYFRKKNSYKDISVLVFLPTAQIILVANKCFITLRSL